jgi:hypothetical protein
MRRCKIHCDLGRNGRLADCDSRTECATNASNWLSMDRSGPGLFDEGFLSGLREHGYEAGPSSIGGPKAKRNDSQN